MNIYSMKIVDRIYTIDIAMPKRGDGVPMHRHDPSTAHTIKVLRGSVITYGPGKTWSKMIQVGEIYDFAADQQEHEIAALEDDTLIRNTIKELMPEGLTIDESGADMNSITLPLPSMFAA